MYACACACVCANDCLGYKWVCVLCPAMPLFQLMYARSFIPRSRFLRRSYYSLYYARRFAVGGGFSAESNFRETWLNKDGKVPKGLSLDENPFLREETLQACALESSRVLRLDKIESRAGSNKRAGGGKAAWILGPNHRHSLGEFNSIHPESFRLCSGNFVEMCLDARIESAGISATRVPLVAPNDTSVEYEFHPYFRRVRFRFRMLRGTRIFHEAACDLSRSCEIISRSCEN